jgi:hypothetical protein
MVYRLLADVVMTVHFAFILFVALGGILAWRWRRLLWVHIVTVLWGAGIVWIGWECPLTPLEEYLRTLGGEQGWDEGFVDRYIEGVIYPAEYTPHLRALAALAIAVGWFGLLFKRFTGRQGPGSAHA